MEQASIESEKYFARAERELAPLIRASVRKLVAPTDQDDVEAEIWVSIWTALQRFEGRSSLKTFIYPIVRRRIADYFRAKYREARIMKEAQGHVKAEDYIAPDFSRVTGLVSPAELRVFKRLAEGRSNDEISGDLFLSKDTVRSHVKALYKKTMLKNRGELVLLAHRFYKEEP